MPKKSALHPCTKISLSTVGSLYFDHYRLHLNCAQIHFFHATLLISPHFTCFPFLPQTSSFSDFSPSKPPYSADLGEINSLCGHKHPTAITSLSLPSNFLRIFLHALWSGEKPLVKIRRTAVKSCASTSLKRHGKAIAFRHQQMIHYSYTDCPKTTVLPAALLAPQAHLAEMALRTEAPWEGNTTGSKFTSCLDHPDLTQ